MRQYATITVLLNDYTSTYHISTQGIKAMAKNAETSTEIPAATKARKTRSPSGPKAVFAVIQVLGEDGNPVAVPKGQVRVVSFEKSAEAVLTKVESGEYAHALYLRGFIPAGR